MKLTCPTIQYLHILGSQTQQAQDSCVCYRYIAFWDIDAVMFEGFSGGLNWWVGLMTTNRAWGRFWEKKFGKNCMKKKLGKYF